MADKVALGIAPDGSVVPIRLTPAGLLQVSGGSGSVQGPGVYKGESFVLMGIASDGQITPIAVDSSGNVQSSGGGGGGSGTVTSVGLTVPSILTVAGTPVTTSGTLAVTLATQTANTVFAGPTSGGVVTPTFRALVGADLPATITKATAFNIAGAASAPALSITGVPFAGTGTTSFPQLYINDSTATPSTTLSTAGTYLGVNGHGTKDLMNLMVDGVSLVKATSAGAVVATSNASTPSFYSDQSSTLGFVFPTSQTIAFTNAGRKYMSFNSSIFTLDVNAALGWSSNQVGTNAADLTLYRDAANILAQRNGVNAQTFNIYNAYTDASNYSRFSMIAAAGGSSFIQEQAGTGGALFMQFKTRGATSIYFGTNNTDRWEFSSSGHLLASGADNTYDIGASGATRPRTIYVGTSINIASGPTLGNSGGYLTNSGGYFSSTGNYGNTAGTVFTVQAGGKTNDKAFNITAPIYPQTGESPAFVTTPSLGITVTTGFTNQRLHQFGTVTITAATAQTITNAANVYIAGAIVAGTNLTITNNYALWSAGGALRFDGNTYTPQAGVLAYALTATGSGANNPATAAQNGWLQLEDATGKFWVPIWR